MIVKIGNKFYNSTEVPILLIVNDTEKGHIANMANKRYCSFPDGGADIDEMKEFMKVSDDVLESVEYEYENPQ